MKKIGGAILLVVAIAAIGLVAMLYVEDKRAPDAGGEYVALGSSYAAGPLLGERVPGSPHACWRTLENYPHQLARRLGLRLVDESCGGATAKHLLSGGPLFQRPQIEAVGASAKLITITIGGNDVDYARDLGLAAYRSRPGVVGTLVRTLWSGPQAVEARNFDALEQSLIAIVDTARRAAPQATIVFVTYPNVIPEQGTCAALALDEVDAALMRAVGQKLADTTRAAARAMNAVLVDIAGASNGHDACSADPWVNGAAPEHGAQFHPNLAGARAIAAQIESTLRTSR